MSELEYPQRKNGPGLASALWSAARVATDAGEHAAAERFASDAFGVAASVARDPSRSADVGQALLLRGKARLALGESTSGIADLRDAVEALEHGFGPDHPEAVEAAGLLGRVAH